MGPYAGNKLFEMIALFWFNKKNRIADQKVNSRLVKVVTRHGIVTKQRKDLKGLNLFNYLRRCSHRPKLAT